MSSDLVQVYHNLISMTVAFGHHVVLLYFANVFSALVFVLPKLLSISFRLREVPSLAYVSVFSYLADLLLAAVIVCAICSSV